MSCSVPWRTALRHDGNCPPALWYIRRWMGLNDRGTDPRSAGSQDAADLQAARSVPLERVTRDLGGFRSSQAGVPTVPGAGTPMGLG